MEKKKKSKNDYFVTTVTFLNRQQLDYLDTLGKDCLFRYGHKLSRSKVLSELVDFLVGLKIDIKRLDLKDGSLSKAIKRAIKDGNGREE